MGLLEIFMIEDFCNRAEKNMNNESKGKEEKEDKGIGLFGFIFMLLAFAYARDFFAERVAGYKFHLMIAIIVFTLLIPILIKSGHTIIAKIIFMINVVIGFMMCSVLLSNVMGGMPLYTIIQENLAFAETISIEPIKVIGKIILWILRPFSFVADVIILPLALVPFIQRAIWNKIPY